MHNTLRKSLLLKKNSKYLISLKNANQKLGPLNI